MAREFLPYDLDQQYLLPPSLKEWLPADHLIFFVSDVVDSLDLSAIMAEYQKDELRGRPGYNPAMLLKLLIYGYTQGKTSSRKLERATYEEVPLPRPFRQSASRPRLHRRLPQAPPARPRQPLRPGPSALPGGRTGEPRARGSRRQQDQSQCLQAQGHEL
jgi:hypothetical protein